MEHRTVTNPDSVNLMALPMRFISTAQSCQNHTIQLRPGSTLTNACMVRQDPCIIVSRFQTTPNVETNIPEHPHQCYMTNATSWLPSGGIVPSSPMAVVRIHDKKLDNCLQR